MSPSLVVSDGYGLLDARILTANSAIRRITAVVQKLARLFTRWAFFRWPIGLQFIAAVTAFPTGHIITPLFNWWVDSEGMHRAPLNSKGPAFLKSKIDETGKP